MNYLSLSLVVAISWLAPAVVAAPLRVEHDASVGAIYVFRAADAMPIVTQHARADFRPYIHPLVAPDGNGLLTEFSSSDHSRGIGLSCGFVDLNGRDYSRHPGGTHWRRVSAQVLSGAGTGSDEAARWRTVYELLGKNGDPLLIETQTWQLRELDGEYVLDFEWVGEAKVDVTIGRSDFGGLFLRTPSRDGIAGVVSNGARQQGAHVDGSRAPWVNVGIQVDGRQDLAYIAMLDHPQNEGFPQPWRVDDAMGIGAVGARLGDWKIPKEKRAVMRYRLHVYTAALSAGELHRRWSDFSGRKSTSFLWKIAQKEAKAAELLEPEEAVAAMTVSDEFRVNAFASEPMITQPMAFCWDDRGRIWVAENRDYESRGRGFSNSGDSRILILEDTDRDGVADNRTVFAEGIPFPAAIAVGFEGLWLGAPPNLLYVPDRNHDDVAEMNAIEVRLTGWGIRDRHETLNSFHWGPDGWLYGCQGFATPSRVGKPAGEGRLFKHNEPFPRDIPLAGRGVEINGGVWRYHPTKDRFEVVAHGLSNPWGIDYDAKGQLFVTACVIPHLWHVIPGGIYHRQGGQHFSPYVYSDIRTIADHRHRSAHGGARIYLSDAFPDRYRGRVFMANIHEHAVLTDILEPRGSGFVARHGDNFLLANNAQWIGFSMEIGPEGGVYVLDWHDADICGKDVHNKNTGRIYRVVPTVSTAKNWSGRYGDLRKLSDRQLVELQVSRSAWHARRARVILQSRALSGRIDEAARAALRAIARDGVETDWRLRAIWALHVTGGLTERESVAALGDEDEHVRAWAIQLSCEDLAPSTTMLEAFRAMARTDGSAVVRLYLAAALQRLEHEKRWPIAAELVERFEDANDHNIAKMIWFGIEPLIAQHPQRALRLALKSRIPLIARHIARRLADANEFEVVVAGIGMDSGLRRELLRGLRDALEGRFDVAAPTNWVEVYPKLKDSSDESVAEMALQLAQQFGDNAAAEALLATLTDEDAGLEARKQALLTLTRNKYDQLRPVLLSLLSSELLRRPAIRAMAAFDDEQFSAALLERYGRFSFEEKLEAIHALAARSRSGWKLTQAIGRGDVPRRDVPAYVARQLRRVVGSGFVEIWGPLDALPAETEAALTKYRALLTEEAITRADPRRGRAVFKRACLSCHKLYGEGGRIGPDITGANRTDLNYLLGNIVTPSEVIQDDYRMLSLLTNEGRLYSGILAGENERQISLRVVGEDEPLQIPKSSIASREVANVSMMPQGLLLNLTDREVLDLVAYLQTPAQVPLPEETR